MTNKRFGRTDILSVKPRTKDIDDIPGWDGYVTIRELTAQDVLRINDMRDAGAGHLVLSAQYMICALVDEDGNNLFTNDDVDRLIELGYDAITHITEKILILSGLLDEDEGLGNA